MDFSRLPDTAFLKILEYLPLEECIRSGRVDKSFRRMAQLATSHTKSLNLFDNRFRKLTPDQLAIILNLCSPNLERIKIKSYFDLCGDGFHEQQLAATFANFECPRLIDMNLEFILIDRDVFEQLIRNCPNVESLVWHGEFVGFPAITSNNLKKLRLKIYGDASLQTLIGRCPNLEEAVLGLRNISASVLDQFCASIPRAQRISINLINMVASVFEGAELVNFYHLPLTELSIDFDFNNYAGDILLHKVVKSFPRLRELSLDLGPTNQGIASLANLQELQCVYLKLRGDGSSEYDQGIRQLAHCHKLRALVVYESKISGGNLVNLVRSCPQLEHVVIWDITEVESPEEAVVILQSLAGIPQRDIAISFCNYDDESFESTWQGETAKAAIKKLEDEDGLKIKIGR